MPYKWDRSEADYHDGFEDGFKEGLRLAAKACMDRASMPWDGFRYTFCELVDMAARIRAIEVTQHGTEARSQ